MAAFGSLRAGLISAVLLVSAFAGIQPVSAAGFQWAEAPDPAGKPLAVGIWYPSDAPVPDAPNTPFRQALAIDGPVKGDRLPLVVISHGSGGWLGGHAATALALVEAGFVVVAVTHTGNNYEDETAPASRFMLDRPRHIARVVDFMLGGWSGRAQLDASRIGLFGFSAGGYTALVSVGGVPNLSLVPAHCARRPEEFVCASGMLDDFGTAAVQATPQSAFVRESRIGAAAIAAPGMGFAFDEAGLADVTVPIQLWSGSNDDRVPTSDNAARVRDALPTLPEFHLVDGAGHFSFMGPCNPRLKEVEPEVWEMVCVDAPGFDRAAFHREFNDEVTAFFQRSLPKR